MSGPHDNQRIAHAFTVLAYEAARSADGYRMTPWDQPGGVVRRLRDLQTERAIAFARAADEALGLVSPS